MSHSIILRHTSNKMSGMKQLKVLILDDHPIFRQGLLKLLEGLPFIDTIHETGSPKIALDKIFEQKIDVLLLDLQMPEMEGTAFLDELNTKVNTHNPKRIIISVLEDKPTLTACYKRGIHGYIPKSTSKAEVTKLFTRLIEDELYFTKKVSDFLFNEALKPVNKSLGERERNLSDTEIKIAILNCFQYNISEMADILCLAVGTIKTHRHNIYKKTKTSNMVGLGFYALEEGYITQKDLQKDDYIIVFDRLFGHPKLH